MKWWQKLFVIVLFSYSFYNVYRSYKAREMGGPERFEDSARTLTCTMYYTTWCGYCKKAKPHWQKIMDELNNKTVDAKTIVIKMIDCDQYPEIAKSEKVDGYPTFKFVFDGKYLDYKGGHTYDEFKSFIMGA
jgi:thiol-disulfide isomerase/thioredoxin